MAENPKNEDAPVEGEGLEAEDAPKEDPDAPEAKAEAEEKPKRKSRAKKKDDDAAAEEKPKPKRTRKKAEPKADEAGDDAKDDDAADGKVIVRAKARYVRTAPRKARLVVDHIRGKSVDEARAILIHTPRAASRDVLKLLDSAIANAENNHELVADELKIHQAFVDEGPTLKRYRPRALGRATRIRKRTSHMTILLTPKE